MTKLRVRCGEPAHAGGWRLAQHLLAALALWLLLAGCATAPSFSTRTDYDAQRLVDELGQRVLAVSENRDRASLYRFVLADLSAQNFAGVSVGDHLIYANYELASRAAAAGRGSEYTTWLWMVLAHEIGHDVMGHVADQKALAGAFQAAQTAGSVMSYAPGILGLVGAAASWLFYGAGAAATSLYARSQELEADRKAIEYWKRMGLDCRVWVQRFQALVDRGIKGDFGHPTEGRLEQAKALCPSAEVALSRQPVPPASAPSVAPPVILAPAPGGALDLPPGDRIIVVTWKGLVYPGTLREARAGRYLVEDAGVSWLVRHEDVAEVRYYRWLAPWERERVRTLPLMRLRRLDGSEVTGWVREPDADTYQVTLQHDESTLLIRKARVVSVLLLSPAEVPRSEPAPTGPPAVANPPPPLAGRIEELGRGVGVRELSQRAETAVVLVYRERSPYSERVEEYLRRIAERFAGRATFFRSEISATAPDLVGPEANTTPILIVLRKGKERARVTGLPADRHPGASAEDALAAWLADQLKEKQEDD